MLLSKAFDDQAVLSRTWLCLSQEALSILSGTTDDIPHQYRDSVFFFTADEACAFLESRFKTEDFYSEADKKLTTFKSAKITTLDEEQLQLRRLLDAVGAQGVMVTADSHNKINLGSGKKYMPGWINIDINPSSNPDIALDLCQELSWPFLGYSKYLGPLRIEENSIEFIMADNVLEHVSDLPKLMTNCLSMLRVGGKMEIIVPYEKSPTAWQDPTHVRAFNEKKLDILHAMVLVFGVVPSPLQS